MEEQLILDRYRPLADLGSGGFGSVMLAFDTRMARRVAIKRIPLPRTHQGGPGRAGLAEARTAAMLNHPAIVTVHEWDTDGADAFIVMEDIDGASLAEIIDDRQEPLDLDEAAWVLDAVGDAVAYAHDNGVLHLDLKPANVLVTRDGRVKVADFGIAALTDASGRARGASGTIGYMPPEQIRGGHLDERTDVWALGALFYELLTRADPFDADTPEGSLFKIEVAPVPAPTEFVPSLGVDVDDVLLMALAPDPDDRFGSVDEFAEDLAPLLGDARTGRRRLADHLTESLGDDIEFEGEHGRLGAWDTLSRYAPALRRASAALVCGWLGWAGLTAVLAGAAPAAGGALIGLAGALAPGLGLALGGIAISVGIGVSVAWWAGVIAITVVAALWAVRGRHGRGDGLLPAAGPALAVIGGAPVVPLIAGFVFAPLPAAIAGGLSALLTALVSAYGGAGAPLLANDGRWLLDPWTSGVPTSTVLNALADPGLLAVIAAWALAAAVASAACRRLTRAWAALGAIVGIGLMTGGYAAWGLIAGDTGLLWRSVPGLAISAALMAGAIALGPPARPSGE